MIDRFQGDPKLYLTPSGVEMVFNGGQPVMDAGLENLAGISLFTGPGWWGNSLTTVEDEVIGSDFEGTAKGAITLQKLTDIKQSGEKALENPAFGNVQATVTNPVNWRIDMSALITPPGEDVQELRLTRNAQNWQNQAAIPASEQDQPQAEGPVQVPVNNIFISEDEAAYISEDGADYISETYLI